MSADSDALEAWKRAAIALSRRVWGCASCRSVNLDEPDGSCPQCGQLMQEHDGATLIARWNTEDGVRDAEQVREINAERDRLMKLLFASHDEAARLRAQVARLRSLIAQADEVSIRSSCGFCLKTHMILAEPAPEGQR